MTGKTENMPGTSIGSLTCVLHIGPGPEADQSSIKNFDQKTWNNVLHIAEVRKNKFKLSKYIPICEKLLSLEISKDIGYHSEGYKKFTAIPKVIEQTKDLCSSAPLLRSKTSTSTHQSTNTGILKRCMHIL